MAGLIDKEIKTIFIYGHLGQALGDGILMLPFLIRLRQSFPTAHITWGAGTDTGKAAFTSILNPLIKNLGLLDEIIENVRLPRKWSALWSWHGPFNGRKFDLVFDTQTLLVRTLQIKRASDRYFISACFHYFFSSLKPANKLKNINIQKQLLNLLSLATGQPELPFIIDTKDQLAKSEASKLLPKGRSYIAFAPGSGSSSLAMEKRWPIERVIEIAKTLKDPVIFLGPNEANLVEPIRMALPHVHLPLQYSAYKSPTLAIECAKRCLAGLSNDTSIGHVFSAAGIPIIFLSYRHNSTQEWSPSTVYEALCAEEYAPLGKQKMNLIPIKRVSDALRNLFIAKNFDLTTIYQNEYILFEKDH